MAHDVFISYPHHNQAVADAACARLEARGIRCWIAPRDIAPGAEWAASIVDAIRACRALVLIFSSHANESVQVQREVQLGFDQGKPVIPFRIEAIAPEKSLAYYLPSVHWLDASRPPIEQHLDGLVNAVRAALEGWSAVEQVGATNESREKTKVREPLQIVVGEDGPFMESPKGGPWSLTRRLKIAVRNNQVSNTITGCKVQITDIQPYSGYRGPWLLAEEFTLSAGDESYIPVVQYGEARDKAKYDCADTIIEVCS
jgi:TIR domain